MPNENKAVAIFIPMLITGVVAMVLIFVLDLPLRLGAHPFWASNVIWMGGSAGIILAFLAASTPKTARAIAFAVLCFCAYVIADFGKVRFAASYAEDVFAGKLWFFGWNATCAFFVATCASIAGQKR